LLDALAELRLRGRKALAILLDPDDFATGQLHHLLQLARQHPVEKETKI